MFDSETGLLLPKYIPCQVLVYLDFPACFPQDTENTITQIWYYFLPRKRHSNIVCGVTKANNIVYLFLHISSSFDGLLSSFMKNPDYKTVGSDWNIFKK